MRSPTPNYLRRPGTPSGFGGGGVSYSGNIKVSVRVKPDGSNNASSSSWDIDTTRNAIGSKELGEFTFDRVFHGPISNENVYNDSVKELVDKVMGGFHATVFAYGMTGSGKTYSMQGTAGNPGIIPLSVRSIFDHVRQNQSERSFNIRVAYLEIYNEHLNDLLSPSTPSDDIRLRESGGGRIRAIGLKEVVVESPEHLLDTIAQGDSIRRTEGTEFNARSSRSHAVVQINIESTPKAPTKQSNIKHNSTLYLCDLAGSERAVSQTERRKEGAYINKSLLTLGTVIARLSTGGPNAGHIPYRDSKLTRLLQPALSGKSLVSVLCTVQTAGPSSAYMETVSTLRFAARAKNVVVNVKRNDEMANDPKTLERLVQQVEAQKIEIQQLRACSGSSISSSSSASSASTALTSPTLSSPPPDGLMDKINQLEAENKILHERVEHLTRLCDDSRLEEVLGFSADESDDSETGDRRQNQQIEEYKSYISHLERQLYQQELSHRTPATVNVDSATNSHYRDIIQDLKDEIEELRESNQDKDRIISALRSVNKRKENLAAFNISTPSNHSTAYSRYYFNNSSSALASPRSLSYSDADEDVTITRTDDDSSAPSSPVKSIA
jgi:centromeric protein E